MILALAFAAFVAASLALLAGLVFDSVLVTLVALPAVMLICGCSALIYGLARASRVEIDEEIELVSRLERGGHYLQARRALDRAIDRCELMPPWDGTECVRCHALRRWRERLTIPGREYP